MDKINKFLAYNGRINVICCDTTTLVEEARKIHDLSPVVTAALGRLLTVTSLMATDLKNKEDKVDAVCIVAYHVKYKKLVIITRLNLVVVI